MTVFNVVVDDKEDKEVGEGESDVQTEMGEHKQSFT